MEESPLTKAHDHARAASNATHQSESTVAVNEHALAAGEFSNAAKSTSSAEALRTLRLLESHHKRLSELLKLPPNSKANPIDVDEKQDPATTGVDAKIENDTSAVKPDDQPPSSATVLASTATPDGTKAGAQALSLAQQKRYPSRPMASSSSIAGNLASARGIRSRDRDRGQPVPPSVSNDQAPGSLDASPRRENAASGSRSKMQNVLDHSHTGKPGWVPPGSRGARKELDPLEEMSETETPAPAPAPAPGSAQSDDNYSRFYNTFGGIINRLSAPLAFAGLPLVAEEEESAPPPTSAAAPPKQREPSNNSRDGSPVTTRRSKRQSHRALHKSPASQAEPDLSKIYSRATMNAISGQNPSESFYVVPTSGHTISYANILNYADKEKRRLEASMHLGGEASLLEDEEDDFVDARESPSGPPSPVTRRGRSSARGAGHGAGPSGHGTFGGKARAGATSKTAEELALENKSLKEVLDKLSRRLHAFEASAQNSHLALAESMRLRPPGSPMNLSAGSATGGTGGTGAGAGAGAGAGDEGGAARTKNKELEDQLALALKRMETIEKENQKMRGTLGKYREKWEALKAGAKARREAQGNSVENAAAAAGVEAGDPGTPEA